MNDRNKSKKIKVAWYENNSHFAEPIRHYLRRETGGGDFPVFEVEMFGDPHRAEEEICEFGPDLVIFDYRMEHFTGIEMYKKLLGKELKFVAVFFSIWADDDATREEILKTDVSPKAIFDKQQLPGSFSRALYDYYMEVKK